MSDERANMYLTLMINATTIGTDDGMFFGKSIEFKDGATTIFGGVVKKLRLTRPSGDTGASTMLYMSITCHDYREIAARRVTTISEPSETTAGDLVDAVVDILNMTGYDDNVTKGTINDGATITSYVSGVKTVKEIFDDLATASGFKWTIDETKTLDFIQEDTILDAPYDLVESGSFTDFNIKALTVDGTNYRNKQWILGALDSTGAEVNISEEDATEISDRATIESASGVYGNIIHAVDSQSDTDASITAENALKRYGRVPYLLDFTTFTNTFKAGTKLKVNLPTMGIASDMYFLIEEVMITDEGGTLKSTISCTRRDNASFSTQRTENYFDYFSELAKKSNVKSTSGTEVFVQEEEPFGAPDDTLWVDTNDYSKYDVVEYSAAATLDIKDGEVIYCDGTFALTLFSANEQEGVVCIIKNMGTGTITVTPDGSETIDGASTYSLSSQYDVVNIVSNGTNWTVIYEV